MWGKPRRCAKNSSNKAIEAKCYVRLASKNSRECEGHTGRRTAIACDSEQALSSSLKALPQGSGDGSHYPKRCVSSRSRSQPTPSVTWTTTASVRFVCLQRHVDPKFNLCRQ